MYDGKLCYVQGFTNDCDDDIAGIINDRIYDNEKCDYNNDITQSEAEDSLLEHFPPKFNNPETHIMDTELYYDPIGFVGYSWPLEAVAEKLQEKDMRFFCVGFDEEY